MNITLKPKANYRIIVRDEETRKSKSFGIQTDEDLSRILRITMKLLRRYNDKKNKNSS